MPEPAPRPVAPPARARGLLLLSVSALAFGVMFLCTKLASARLPGAEVAAARFAISVGVVAALWLAGAIRVQPGREQLPLLVLRGASGGVAVLLLFVAVARGNMGTATLLNFTSPAFTAVFAWIFLRERLSRWVIVAFVTAGVGVALVLRGSSGGGPLRLWGWQSLGLVSAALAGAAVTAIRALRRHRAAGAWTVFTFFSVCGLLCTTPLAAARFLMPSGREWLFLVAMGLLSVVGQVLMTHALAFVTAALSGVIQQLTVVTTFLLGFLFLGEPLTGVALAGSALTIAGVAWAAWLTQTSEA